MTPCREWIGAVNKEGGYGVRRINGRNVRVHRWVWEQINGPIAPGMVIMHVCDNPLCYRYDHLRLGTMADNNADRNAKDRHTKGEQHPFSKLTEQQVREIAVSSETAKDLASIYGVSRNHVYRIKRGLTWGHVTTHQGEK